MTPTRRTGILLALATALISGFSVFLNSYGVKALGTVGAGDWVSLHWEWVCERLRPRQLAALRHHTLTQLDVVNGVAVPAPNAVLA